MINLIGWLGSLCFVISVIPQIIKCYIQKHAKGISGYLLILILMGSLANSIYSYSIKAYPTFVNSVLTFIGWITITYYWSKNEKST